MTPRPIVTHVSKHVYPHCHRHHTPNSRPMTPTIYPRPLQPGDTIAICSPAGPIARDLVEQAAEVLSSQGWNVRVMPHTFGHWGNYSGTDYERYDDLASALTDPHVRAIIASRGGYGTVHILDRLNNLDLAANPKWIVGFSDISALHALMNVHGLASIHASMAKHIRRGADDPDNAMLFEILRGNHNAVTLPTSPLNRHGSGQGRLRGGNLAVLADLIMTRYDMMIPGSVLFIEDIAEPIYKVERILYQLKIAGILGSLSGLIVGQFTDYRPDKSYNTMEDMISDMVSDYNYPVAFNAPIGHVDHNIPVIENADVTLTVSPSGPTRLIYN